MTTPKLVTDVTQVESLADDDLILAGRGDGQFIGIKNEDFRETVRGLQGYTGWTPVIATEVVGARVVLKVSDWVNGTGSKPAVGYLGPYGLVETSEAAVDIAADLGSATAAAIATATTQAGISSAQRALAETARTGAETARTGAETAQATATTQAGISSAQRALAETARTGAEAARDAAQIAALAIPFYQDSRSLLPRGVAFGAVTGGSGYTNGGPYALAFSGGNMEANPTGTFMVSGGAIGTVVMTSPGRKIGAATHTLPTASFAAAGAGTGGALALTSVSLIASGQYYWTDHATDSSLLILYSNIPVAGVPTATSQITTISKGSSPSLIALTAPTGTANAMVSTVPADTPVVAGAANQLLLLPIVSTNTGSVTLTVPGVGGGIARPVRASLSLSLSAKSLIAGQFALLKYMPVLGVYLLIYPNNLSQNGRFSHLFRTGASAVNALVTTTQYGDLGAYNVNDLFLCPMAGSNTLGAVTMNIDGIGAKPLMSHTGDPLPVPAWSDTGVVLFRYRPDIDKFVLVVTNYTLSPSDALVPAKTPSYNVVGTAVADGGDPTKLLVTPLTPLPNNSFANTYLHVRFPADRPAESGMLIKIVGFNDSEYLQIRDLNAVDQVAAGRWLAGDVGVIARDPVSSRFYLVRVDRRTSATEAATAPSQSDFYAMANSRIYALSSFGK